MINEDITLYYFNQLSDYKGAFDTTRIKQYMRNKGIRCTKKNVDTFINELQTSLLNFLNTNYSKNEYFGIKRNFSSIIENDRLILRCEEEPIDENSILLAH